MAVTTARGAQCIGAAGRSTGCQWARQLSIGPADLDWSREYNEGFDGGYVR